MKAIWNKQVIAESEKTTFLDGNYYFPPSSINKDFLNNSDTHIICSKKGEASYFTIAVNGQINIDAAWYYPIPKDNVKHIANYVAFWKGVEIQ